VTNRTTEQKENKTVQYEKVEAILMEWFRQLTVDGPSLKRKAEEIATKLNTDFRPPNGWIDGFKKRSGLVYRKVCGEANSVNPEAMVAWKDTTLVHLMAKYSPTDIFSAYEFGLFYNMLPDKR
jgi:hypothetical protein